jgi:hypothetical protein
MKCYFCKKIMQDELEEPICVECEEAAYLIHGMHSAQKQWYDSLYKDDFLWGRSLSLISRMIDQIDKDLPFEEQAVKLDEEIVSLIKTVISFYHKNDLLVATLVVKEGARVWMIDEENSDPWLAVNEYEVSLILQKIIHSMKTQEFLGHSLDELDSGYHGFITALVLTRNLVMLRDNLERNRWFNFTVDLFELVKGLYETDALKEYFDRLAQMGVAEKPEDIEIKGLVLRSHLEARGLSKDAIYDSVENEVQKTFGFNFSELRKAATPLWVKQELNFPLFISRKDQFIKSFDSVMDREKVDKIIHWLSIDQLFTKGGQVTERQLELRSFFEAEEFIICGKLDLLQNIHTFQSIIFSGHFLSIYFPEVDPSHVFQNAQEQMSTLMSYYVAEHFNKAGYLLPTEKVPRKLGGGHVIRAEINKIIKDDQNLLQGYGDIDVLALDQERHEILLIELKYFKPALNIGEMISADKRKIYKKNVIEKILKRQSVIEEYKGTVIEYIGGDISREYNVRSIILTARPNFYAIEENLGVEYLTWTELQHLLNEKQI